MPDPADRADALDDPGPAEADLAEGEADAGTLSALQIEVAHKLISVIRSGRWQLGERISDAGLAREFAISRSPIRQVLQYLVARGFLAQRDRGFTLARAPEDFDLAEELFPPSGGEQLYRRVLQARASGEIGPEATEAELLDLLDAPRSALRRTLMRLSAEGLAERREGHGWRFAECLDNVQAVNESYAFRTVIECGAVQEDTFRADPQELAALEAEQRALLAVSLAEIRGSDWFEANARFHETVVSWSRNRFLVRAIQLQNNLRRMTEYSEFTQLTEQGLRRAAQDHLAILQAIRQGDRRLAAALLVRHLSRVRPETDAPG